MKKLFWLVLVLLIISVGVNLAALYVLDKAFYYRDYIHWFEEKFVNEGIRLTNNMELRNANLPQMGVFLGGDLVRFWVFPTNYSYRIVNKGGREEPTRVTHDRFEEHVVRAGADFVLINTGFCDIYSAINTGKRVGPVIEQNFDYTKKMVDMARANNIKPILTTLNPVRPRFLLPHNRWWTYSSKNKEAENQAYQQYNALIHDYCAKEGVDLIDFHRALSDENGELIARYSLPDGEHIHHEGYSYLTHFLRDELDRIFKK